MFIRSFSFVGIMLVVLGCGEALRENHGARRSNPALTGRGGYFSTGRNTDNATQRKRIELDVSLGELGAQISESSDILRSVKSSELNEAQKYTFAEVSAALAKVSKEWDLVFDADCKNCSEQQELDTLKLNLDDLGKKTKRLITSSRNEFRPLLAKDRKADEDNLDFSERRRRIFSQFTARAKTALEIIRLLEEIKPLFSKISSEDLSRWGEAKTHVRGFMTDYNFMRVSLTRSQDFGVIADITFLYARGYKLSDLESDLKKILEQEK